MDIYRQKNDPGAGRSLPNTLSDKTYCWTGPKGSTLPLEIALHFGWYRDISPEPPPGYQLGDVATWEEETATVIMNVVEITTIDVTKDRRNEILERLQEVDRLSVRPLRAILANISSPEDSQYLTELENEAVILRNELALLS